MGLMVGGARSAGQFQLYSSSGGDSVLAVESLRRAFFLGRSLSGKSAIEICDGMLLSNCDGLSQNGFEVVEEGDPVSFVAAWPSPTRASGRRRLFFSFFHMKRTQQSSHSASSTLAPILCSFQWKQKGDARNW